MLLHVIFIAATKSQNHVGALPVVRWCRKSFEKSEEQVVSSNLTDVWQPCALLSRTCKLFLHLTEKTPLLTLHYNTDTSLDWKKLHFWHLTNTATLTLHLTEKTSISTATTVEIWQWRQWCSIFYKVQSSTTLVSCPTRCNTQIKKKYCTAMCYHHTDRGRKKYVD